MRNLFAALIIISLLIVVFLSYAGFFHKVNITEGPAGPYIFVYVKAAGPYHKSGKHMDEVYKRLEAAGIEATKGAGMYFDDPKTAERGTTRYAAGCIAEETAGLEKLGGGLAVKEFAAKRCLTAEFPYRNRLNIMAGALKVYPAIADYIKANGLQMNAVMEIYDAPAQRITYIMPLDPGFDAVKSFYM